MNQQSHIPLLSPEVDFKHERIPPPPGAYITKDDYLAVSVYTTSSTSGLKLAYRFLDSAGAVHYGSESLDGASTSTLTTKIFPLTEGFLLGASVSNLGGGLADQVCFASIALQRSSQASTPPHTVLSQGYVSNLFSVVWPPTMPRGPATGAGLDAWPGLANSINRPPTTPNALDDEFDAAILDTAKWTWVNQGTATATLANSHLILASPAHTGDDNKLIVQPKPTGAYQFTAPISSPLVMGYGSYGLALRSGTTGYIIAFYVHSQTHVLPSLVVNRFTSATAYDSNKYTGTLYLWYGLAYLRITDNGTSTLTYSFSADGISYVDVYSESRTDFMVAGPTQVAMGTNSYANVPITISSDWFRRTA